MIRIPCAGALGLAAILSAGTSLAADEPDELMPGRVAMIRYGVIAKFVSKAPVAFNLPAANNAPTVEGGVLNIFDTAGSEGDTYNLPVQTAPLGWKALGNPPGSKGYKYKGAGSMDDPCKVVLVKTKVVKAVCKGGGVQMVTPFTGNIGVVLAIGTDTKNYCAEFGGTAVKSDATLLKRKTADPPAMCPTQGPGSTSTSSSSTSSTSTSSAPGATTTSTTFPPGVPCCNNNNFAVFTNNIGSGNCGSFVNNDGSSFSSGLKCGGLYFGGGSNTVPLPAITPDFASSITKITSCTGQTATVGPSTSTETGTILNCTTPGCYFGGPLPIPNTVTTPTSTCVWNSVRTAASGTLDCALGTAQISLPLDSEIFLTGDTGTDPLGTIPGIQPCPLCTGGTPHETNSGICQGGANAGSPCTPENSAQNAAYPTSHDCEPLLDFSIGTIPIGFALDSGTVSWTATPAPNPVSTGQTRVFCGYCRNNATLAFQDPFQQCWENGMAVGPACTFGAPDAVCTQQNQGAFGPAGGTVKTITAVGAAAGSIVDGLPHAQTLVSVFCIPPTFNFTIDNAANLPGPGAVAFNGDMQVCATANPCP